MNDPLFQPLAVGSLELPNRIVMPAMHLAMGRAFQVTDAIVDFNERRARGGAGALIVGYATVDLASGNPSNIGAHSDEHIPGLTRLADAIKQHGSRAVVQINHAGRYNYSLFLGGKPGLAPSAVPCRQTRETPRPMTPEQILEAIDAFAQAARRVRDAGFDAVEILAGTGYLISQFLSPRTNLRDDAWGGGFMERARFGREVVRAVRAAVGPDYPILARVNGNDMVPGGIGPEELRDFSKLLVVEGVDALDMNVGWHESKVPQIASEVPAAAFAYLARDLRKAVDVPVIAGHRIDDPDLARKLLSDGACDAVAMGRALIADPDLPNKAREGNESRILHCVSCGQGCLDSIFHMRQVRCLANPRAGVERFRGLTPADPPGHVVVVGGGPAGMSAATAAAERGHRVTLFEASGRLGGQLHLAGAPPGRSQFQRLAIEMAARAGAAGVRIELGQRVDAERIAAEKPSAVLLATGALPVTPALPGADADHVVQAWEILSGAVAPGQEVVVIGGNAVGVETALLVAERGALSAEAVKFLLTHDADTPENIAAAARSGGREVRVVELAPKLGVDLGKSTRWGMLLDVERCGVDVRLGMKAVAIEPGGVRVEPSTGGESVLLRADTVILALGARPYNPLEAELTELGVPVKVVGDADRVADAMKAIHNGYQAARKLDISEV